MMIYISYLILFFTEVLNLRSRTLRIYAITYDMCMFVFLSLFWWKFNSPPIMMIYISSELCFCERFQIQSREIYKSISGIHIWHISSFNIFVECSKRFKKRIGLYSQISPLQSWHVSHATHTCVYQYINKWKHLSPIFIIATYTKEAIAVI